MEPSIDRAIAIVGLGAILPDAPDVSTFWANVAEGRYSISDVTDRWDASLYYDSDPRAPDKTYSKIGGWVREYDWDPIGWRMPIPPKVGDLMDPAQKWAVAASRQALLDYGYPERPIDKDRMAVIMGNALGGDFHLLSAARILFPEVGEELRKAPSFQALPEEVRTAVMEELLAGVRTRVPDITEDTMPGELGNIVAGRVAALYDFKGPNYIADAACASAMAAMTAAVEGLVEHQYDAVLTGGIDANMSASTFVKFAKIGALSATGTRPYAEGADGFVMGEGAAVFLLKRLEDAERDGDAVYGVILGIGGSSDGKGKGITAPNPVGQRFAVRRAWERAGVSPCAGDLIEGHGTSTRVGDVVEVESLAEVFSDLGLPVGSMALGSVKSNIGHLKGAAGAAGILKATLALHHEALPPSVNFHAPNPAIDFSASPMSVNTELREWKKPGANGGGVRRAGVSAFGFGGTNFHVVLEEHVPGRLKPRRAQVTGAEWTVREERRGTSRPDMKLPLRGALVVGGTSESEIVERLRGIRARAEAGDAPASTPPLRSDLQAPVRVAIDYGDAAELADLAGRAIGALEAGEQGRWRALRNKGIFLGRGGPGKVAFLFTGQGSQYVGMLEELRAREPIVADTFDEADRVMGPILGGPLSDRIFVDVEDPEATARAEEGLKQTAITQPAVLTVDTALCRLFGAWGIEPDLVMGHSLGEYGALVAAGGLPFGDALTAVAARGDAMTRLALEDNGIMAAAFGPVDDITRIVDGVDGYVVVANVNSTKECVIGGATDAVQRATDTLKEAGYRVAQLPVSHAFHTRIVEPAAEPLREVLRGLGLKAPDIPVVANVDASFYPSGPDAADKMVDILGRQIGSPVQFVKGLETLYEAGARTFIEMGPKRALYGMADDVVGGRDGVTVLYTNHARNSDVVSVNRALCGLYALGLGDGRTEAEGTTAADGPDVDTYPVTASLSDPAPRSGQTPTTSEPGTASASPDGAVDRYVTLGRMFADFLDKSFETFAGTGAKDTPPVRVGITGAALGLPGRERVFDDENVLRILRGDGFITPVPDGLRAKILDRRITRLVKGPNGEARFETIEDPDEVIRLAGQAGSLDLVSDYGFPEDRLQALDWVTQLAIAAGIDALRDAGIPLVRRYKTTSTGSKLPEGWGLPESMRDDTAVIFGSAFPGYGRFARIMNEYYEDRVRRARLAELEKLRDQVSHPAALVELNQAIHALSEEIEQRAFRFDRRFLFQVLAFGHAQFAEYIGARGPNIGTNQACATGTQAVALAQDWIQAGRCRRAIVITADDITTPDMFPWFASGFLASGAAATDARVEDAALPFDRRRHGLIIGMGGAALVVEDLSAASERGLWPICEVMGTKVANSAFHGSRLDVEHIANVMEELVSEVEDRWGLSRHAMAPEAVFVSHETYTPARGGSASAEVRALRQVFGSNADAIVVANTKGYTGHPMGVAIEDTLATKILETGIVPPVANFREVDPELGTLNLSRGGRYPIRYALRFAAGFGSQISMSLLRWTPPPDGARRDPADLGFRHRVADADVWATWLRQVTGYDAPELEIVQRTLRVKDQGPTEARVGPPTRAAVAAPPAFVPASAGEPAAPPRPIASPPVVPEAAAAPAAAASPSEESAEVGGPAAEPAGEPAVVAAAGAPAAAASEAAMDPVAVKVLEIVSEQTGYPPDMLELDLDLEADLGIDTVKQAEMFAAIRAAYDIERDDNLALRDYATLARAIEFVYEKRPDLADARAGEQEAASATAPAVAGPRQGELDLEAPQHDPATESAAEPLVASMEAAQKVPRRVPVARIRPPMDRFPETGVTLAEEARVVVVPDEGGVGTALAERLEKRGVDVLLADPSIGTPHLVGEVEEWLGAGDLTGVYWLPALDPVLPTELTEPEDRREALRRRVKALHALARVLYDPLDGNGRFLVSGTRLGGRHGYDAEGAMDAAGGAVSGFTKAFARERPRTLVKVVDFKMSRKTAALADTLIAETLGDPGVVEVGHTDEGRWAVGLEERPVEPGADLPEGGVYVVTGAAGSIVSAILRDLADSGGTFWLLDKALQPDPTNPDLQRILSDREALRRDIVSRLQADHERVTPVQVEAELARVERESAALAAIQAIEDKGGTVHYRCLDLREPEAVASVTREIVDAHERIDVVLHAAGLEISRAVPAKSPEEFALVFDVKVEGWYNLMTGLGDTPLGSVMTFSSIAGRFGNAGQTDYAAANDLLCKAVSGMGRSRPDTRALSLDWTAWRDIGMAARGSIPTIMKQAGIDMLDPRAGIAVVRRELTAGTRGEVVIAESLGIMLVEDAAAATLHPDVVARGAGPMVGRVRTYSLYDGLVVETDLDPAEQPFLDHHRIDGTPVLPGVMGLEAMAEAARLPFPDLHVAAMEDVAFHAPFKFYRDEPRTLTVQVTYESDGEDVVADCQVSGERTLVGRDEPERTVHFAGRVRLSGGRAEDGRIRKIPGATDDMVGSADIYDTYFHGPAYRVLEGAWRSEDLVAGLFASDLPPNHEPADRPMLAAPRLVELAFQTAGLVEIASAERMGLPQRFERLELLRAGEGEVESAALARPSGEGVFDVDVTDAAGHIVLSLKGYRTSALPGTVRGGVFRVLRV